MTNLELQKKALDIRKGIVTAVHSAKSGHPGGSLSATDIFTYLYLQTYYTAQIQNVVRFPVLLPESFIRIIVWFASSAAENRSLLENISPRFQYNS